MPIRVASRCVFSIHKLAGTDGTSIFETVHNRGMLEDFEKELIGDLLLA